MYNLTANSIILQSTIKYFVCVIIVKHSGILGKNLQSTIKYFVCVILLKPKCNVPTELTIDN